MQIGLIGGIGPAATNFYYQSLIRAFGKRAAKLELTMVHADTSTLLNNLANSNVADQVAIYETLTNRLEVAGAGCVVVTSIAGHFCIDAFKDVSALPVIDMIAETERAIAQLGLEKIGILGTRTVMESRFYGGITSAEILPPQGEQLDAVHDAYVAMAASGIVTGQQREIFDKACRTLLEEQGAEAIMLGGTDLALVYDQETADFPIIDCAAIHCDAIVEWALANKTSRS